MYKHNFNQTQTLPILINEIIQMLKVLHVTFQYRSIELIKPIQHQPLASLSYLMVRGVDYLGPEGWGRPWVHHGRDHHVKPAALLSGLLQHLQSSHQYIHTKYTLRISLRMCKFIFTNSHKILFLRQALSAFNL